MKAISQPQIQKIHAMLNQLGLMENKKELVLSFSQNRTDSCKGLTSSEAIELVKYLVSVDPGEKHRKAILHLAYKAGMIYGDTKEDYAMNLAKINLFLKSRGVVKKELQQMNQEELKKVHRQFEGILKNTNKTKDNKESKQITDNLLSELQLTVKN